MKKLQIILVSALAIFSTQSLAALISVGPYQIDTDATATSANFYGTVFENTPGAIIGAQENTYIKGTTADAGVTLGFGNTSLSNQNGNDLALFFLTANNTVSLDINGTNNSYTSSQLFVNPADPFVDIGEKYLVTEVLLPSGSLGIFDLSVIFVDLEDFGIGLNQELDSISVNIGNSASFMTIAAGLNGPVTPVPVPAAFFLFLSGLTGLGLISRRKK